MLRGISFGIVSKIHSQYSRSNWSRRGKEFESQWPPQTFARLLSSKQFNTFCSQRILQKLFLSTLQRCLQSQWPHRPLPGYSLQLFLLSANITKTFSTCLAQMQSTPIQIVKSTNPWRLTAISLTVADLPYAFASLLNYFPHCSRSALCLRFPS